ncbi:E3 ubiquitin-protein ligase spl2 [Thalictrum thalictroides]|uniref:RING-type E3 ubiquitin transferase n=1 Tax=Thalictrum thalictroides TaxID=46969 RepID=A0A7J6WJT3_THATH|nr:E3 ubiquitin-protein ligase spl2 [Thalictrum thalictroides]
MSSTINDRLVSLLTQLALATDGLGAGVVLAFFTIQAWKNFRYTSSALERIRHAKSVTISDLRSLLIDDNSSQTQSDKQFVIIRGLVEAKSVVDGSWKNLMPSSSSSSSIGNSGGLLVSHQSGAKGVVLQNTQTCVYNDIKGLFGYAFDFRSLFGNPLRGQKTLSLSTIPFVLVQNGDSKSPDSTDYVFVNLEGSLHPLPLTTCYHHLQPIPTTPYTLIQAIAGYTYPVGLLDEEKILPLGKEITAVGHCTLQDGNPQINACKKIPYFLSDMTKDQMIVHLVSRKKILFWVGIVLGSVSLGVLGYSLTRSWQRLKEWRHRRQIQHSREEEIANLDATTEDNRADEETEDIPEGQLCIICLMRRKRAAFVPCGHFVCCYRCALSVERDSAPKCPLCRQNIRTSVRIYDS